MLARLFRARRLAISSLSSKAMIGPATSFLLDSPASRVNAVPVRLQYVRCCMCLGRAGNGSRRLTSRASASLASGRAGGSGTRRLAFLGAHPYFDAEVVLNADGLHHLRCSDRRERSKVPIRRSSRTLLSPCPRS